jgi:haloalkane dehalogenase
VHGNPTWSFYWRGLVTGLRDEHRVVAPDHLGCGLSDKPQDWSYRLADHVENLSRLVLELDLRDITLGVHDWGGVIGLGVAVRHPERFRRLLIFNTAAFRGKKLPLRLAVCRWPIFGPLAVRGLNAFCLAATFMATERGLKGIVRDGYLAPYGSWQDRIAVLRFVQDIPFETRHPSYSALVEIEEGLGKLADRPTLIVWGERDWVFTPAFREEFERRFPGARSIPLTDAGHLVVEDAPERVLEEVRGFIRQAP